MKAALAALLLGATVFGSADYVKYDSSKKTQLLNVGDVLVVQLQELPGAGYSWQPTKEGRPNLKFTQRMSFKPDGKPAPAAIGGKQLVVMWFRATAAGDATITLNYGRPWLLKKGEKPDKTLKISVSVKAL